MHPKLSSLKSNFLNNKTRTGAHVSSLCKKRCAKNKASHNLYYKVSNGELTKWKIDVKMSVQNLYDKTRSTHDNNRGMFYDIHMNNGTNRGLVYLNVK